MIMVTIISGDKSSGNVDPLFPALFVDIFFSVNICQYIIRFSYSIISAEQ